MSEVDGPRLLTRLEELSAHGRQPSGGVTRLAFSPDDVKARDLVARWMHDAGMTVELDAATNLIGRRPGAHPGAPAIAIGSHLDTVPEGGRLDGAYGVVAAVEAAATCGPLDHALAVVAFANEEGTVAPPGFTGSLAIVGAPPDVGEVVDAAGRTLGDVIGSAGGRPDALASCAWAADSLAAFVELHIEQGPVLESEGCGLGVVDAIAGRSTLEVSITGAAAHAGTTPMADRRDALVAASQLVLAVRSLAAHRVVRVATTGAITCLPNKANVVPSSVRLGVDLRDKDDQRVRAATAELRKAAAEVAKTWHVAVTVTESGFVASAPMDAAVQGVLDEVTRRHASRVTRLPSGAGHDAQIMTRIAPTGMIFVPSRNGISHSPHEWTAPKHLVAGAACLTEAVEVLDARL